MQYQFVIIQKNIETEFSPNTNLYVYKPAFSDTI